jgi:hypothetical protein
MNWLAPLLLLGALLLLGCGYAPLYGSGAGHYEVRPGPYATANFEAAGIAVDGVRAELGSAGALGSGRLVIVEIVRIDERSIGVQAPGTAPLARGSEIVVVGRARIYASAESNAAQWDTGDMSRAVQYAAGITGTEDAIARGKAVRDAARALGRAMARAILGFPEPAEG